MSLVLHGYWRSGTSYRTRIALNLKGLAFEQRGVDLRAGDQGGDAFRALNPQGLVPAVEFEGQVLTQSPAILEWLEERWPEPPLLPSDAQDRARVRAMAAVIGCDIHPLNNLRVLSYLEKEFGATLAQKEAWIRNWVTQGFTALEDLLQRNPGTGEFCEGDDPSLADCCLVPQVYAARRFGFEVEKFPTIKRVYDRCMQLDEFERAQPELQPDAPR